MILNKPYLYVAKTGKKTYQLSIAIQIPDGRDIGQFQRINMDDKVLLVGISVPVPNQVHNGVKEQTIWLDNVEEGLPIEVRIEAALLTPGEREEGTQLDSKTALKRLRERDSYILGQTVILPTTDNGRPETSEDEEDRTNN